MIAELPERFLTALAEVTGPEHVLRGDATAGYVVDWTGKFRGSTPAVVRPGSTEDVQRILVLCAEAGVALVPQGGNTGLVGGGIPLHGEVVLSLARLSQLEPVDLEASQVTAGAGVPLQAVRSAHPDLDFGVNIASRDTATVGGAVATNAGGLRVLRYGPMRSQVRGIEAVLSDGTAVSHLTGLLKDNTGYDYGSLLTGSEGTLAVITRVRLQLVPRLTGLVTALAGLTSLAELHALVRRALVQVRGLVSAEFMTVEGLAILQEHIGLPPPLPVRTPMYVLLEAAGPGALDELADLIGDLPAAVADAGPERARLWAYRERHPEAAGFLGVPIKLDVSAPAATWVQLAESVRGAVRAVDPAAEVLIYGHVADGNIHVNVVPGTEPDGRHEDAVFSRVASLGGSISAEHGIGALKARWLPHEPVGGRTGAICPDSPGPRPAGILNPHVLPR